MSSALLPSNATASEKALADAIALPGGLGSLAGLVGTAKYQIRPPSFLPFLQYEYGVLELAPYLSNPYDLIDQGREWQLLRGTSLAIDLGLSWLGIAAALEEAPAVRRFWNSFQLRFTALPGNDDPLLERIEGITTLSVPLRSKFRRGVYHYDVGALEADYSQLDASMLDHESGVKATLGTRHFPEAATWSFGRTHEIEHVYTEEEGTALGNWLEPVDPEDVLAWTLMTYPWVEATFPWAAGADVQRRALLAGWFATRRIYLALRDGDGETIGWRRCRAVHAVRAEAEGGYLFDGAAYEPAAGAGRLYVEALTDFDDADGVTAAEAALLVDPELAPGVLTGKRWLLPGELSGGVEFAANEISVPLRRTVRDQFKFMVRF